MEARLDGKSKREAALSAGYASPANIEASDDVRTALTHARAELSDATQIKRADVVEMLQEAYHLARSAAEPASMVSAAREIGKMLGFYEPETIKVNLSMDQARLQDKFAVMSDEELLQIAQGKSKIIDGTYTRLS